MPDLVITLSEDEQWRLYELGKKLQAKRSWYDRDRDAPSTVLDVLECIVTRLDSLDTFVEQHDQEDM